MRLIDADKLFIEEREEYRNNADHISTDYEHIFAEIDYAPTVCDLEQIRAEIEEKSRIMTGIHHGVWINLDDVLAIIDKYKAESEDKE